jgi:DNA topoisomerase-1
LLALPREVGIHPEDNEPIIAGVGRFGPYVKHGKTYANLEEGDDVLNVGLNRAVTLIAEKKANPSRGRRFGADPGKVLGEHPDKGGPIVAKKGRYGPYVSHDGINATLPGDKTPDTITLEEAVGLLEARAAKLGPGRKGGKKKAAKKSKIESETMVTEAPKPRRAAGRKSASGKAEKKPAAKAKKPAAAAAKSKPARKTTAAE